ncbi:hypothetical protein C9374_010799 [Naegleria lovaniensis]|uniref:Uncharacterized protein n=1 Tax=Naegleria lovaniensis TaxID=51637 RepID=A0AA88GFG7_NAELO|nr:uncharacterized protein C9374_010799 [Naegleria lovaniensis]KAG2374515.1 hypothetical protein C9374_010799 [Naegleria lovaniensis]
MYNSALEWLQKKLQKLSQSDSESNHQQLNQLEIHSENNGMETSNHSRRRTKWIKFMIILSSGLTLIITIIIYYKIHSKNQHSTTLDFISFRKTPSNYFHEFKSISKTRNSSLNTSRGNSNPSWSSNNTEAYLNDTASYYQYMLSSESSTNGLKFNPQWKFSPSYTDPTTLSSQQKKKTHSSLLPGYGFVQYRSQSLLGREAGLPRVFSSSPSEDLSLLRTNIHGSDFTHDWTYYLEKIRYILSLLYYRLPRAIAEWELWLGMASLGLYHVWMNQPFSKWRNSKEKEKQQQQHEAKHFMDGVMHRVISEKNEIENSRKRNQKIVKIIGEGSNIEGLEENFEKLLSNEQADSYL